MDQYASSTPISVLLTDINPALNQTCSMYVNAHMSDFQGGCMAAQVIEMAVPAWNAPPTKLQVKMDLQKWNGSGWVNIASAPWIGPWTSNPGFSNNVAIAANFAGVKGGSGRFRMAAYGQLFGGDGLWHVTPAAITPEMTIA